MINEMSQYYPRIKILVILALVSTLVPSCSGNSSQNAMGGNSTPTSTPLQVDQLSISFDASVPQALIQAVDANSPIKIAEDGANGDIKVLPDQGAGEIEWIFALAAPFPTVADDVNSSHLRDFWSGDRSEFTGVEKILVTEETALAIENLWGEPDPDHIVVMDKERILNQCWEEANTWAIVPFEELVPQWKVMHIDGQSPLDKELDTQSYPLTVRYGIQADQNVMRALEQANIEPSDWIPYTNRDPQKMTILIMTGVTALVRNTAKKMEEKGITYPAEEIKGLLEDADLLHISNEIAFSENCNSPEKGGIRFCSDPQYIQLLEYIGTDIVELTGNHLLDYGTEPFFYTLDLYHARGWKYYGAGEDLDAARQPITLEHNGNQIAFLGCNIAGPMSTFATTKKAGVATCKFDLLEEQITALKASGHIVILTIQHNEYYRILPPGDQQRDFKKGAETGADIVSGSQAHYPQTFIFIGDSFVHYGLGNFFFDQMDEPKKGTRQEFIDKHVFYEGHHISTELISAMLEDYSQPRPMTPEERESLLQDVLKYVKWISLE
jgi:poly-gamma-glutamate synthesis protein (capsule biosynthesis protein)